MKVQGWLPPTCLPFPRVRHYAAADRNQDPPQHLGVARVVIPSTDLSNEPGNSKSGAVTLNLEAQGGAELCKLRSQECLRCSQSSHRLCQPINGDCNRLALSV